MRASRLGIAAAAAAGVLLAGAAWKERARARHLAIPVLADPSASPAPGVELDELQGCTVREVTRVPARVTALLEVPLTPTLSPGSRRGRGSQADLPSPPAPAGGEGEGEGGVERTLWIGTFDAGLFRLADGELSPVPGLRGRESFVNALAERDGLVWAATQGGALAFDGERRALTLLAGEGVTSLARASASLYAGTARGVFRLSAGAGAQPVDATGPGGEPLRVTALAATATRLWIGTPSGAYSLPLAVAEAPLLARTARWHPLVFGEPPADTNVVTALAPLAGGALAGTDDGGVVRLREDGGVAALRFADARANEVNPGAAADAGGAALVGTQGGGVLLVRAAGTGVSVQRLEELGRAEASALLAAGDAILFGTAAGTVGEARCAPRSARGPGDRVLEPVLAEEQLAPDHEVRRAEDPQPRGLGGPVAERLLHVG